MLPRVTVLSFTAIFDSGYLQAALQTAPFACMEKSTIRHLRRHFRFGFGGLRRRERGDGGVGLFFTVLGGSDGVHLFE